MRRPKKLAVSIPRGSSESLRLKLGGEGDVGPKGGPAGDLYLYLHVQEDERFERQDTELYMEFPVSYAQLALGDDLDVPTMEQSQRLKIPAGTQSGTEFVLRGFGFPQVGDARGRRGDLHVTVQLVVPRDLSDDERDLIRRCDDLHRQRAQRAGHSFMDFLRGILRPKG